MVLWFKLYSFRRIVKQNLSPEVLNPSTAQNPSCSKAICPSAHWNVLFGSWTNPEINQALQIHSQIIWTAHGSQGHNSSCCKAMQHMFISYSIYDLTMWFLRIFYLLFWDQHFLCVSSGVGHQQNGALKVLTTPHSRSRRIAHLGQIFSLHLESFFMTSFCNN